MVGHYRTLEDIDNMLSPCLSDDDMYFVMGALSTVKCEILKMKIQDLEKRLESNEFINELNRKECVISDAMADEMRKIKDDEYNYQRIAEASSELVILERELKLIYELKMIYKKLLKEATNV